MGVTLPDLHLESFTVASLLSLDCRGRRADNREVSWEVVMKSERGQLLR